MRTTALPSSFRLIFQVAFEHQFFADGLLRAMRIVPVGACHDMLRRAGLLLRPMNDGIAAYGDEEAVRRLRLHIAEAGNSLEMAFQVFFTDAHFYEYTALDSCHGKLLFLDTARCTTDESGRQMLHATPCVTAEAFLPRDHIDLMRILGQRVLAPRPDMVLQVVVSNRLLDTAVPAQRQFHARFDAASSHWKYCVLNSNSGNSDNNSGGVKTGIVDLAGDIEFEHVQDVDGADQRRTELFLSKREIPMREVSPAHFQLRCTSPAGEKVLIKRMPNASLGKRLRDSRDGKQILVSEIFVNQ